MTETIQIVGLDSLVFGVDDVSACKQYLTDFGLREVHTSSRSGSFAAADGTSVIIQHHTDPGFSSQGSGPGVKTIVYGVKDQRSLELIAAEMSKDREIRRTEDGRIYCMDDAGFHLGFQITVRGSGKEAEATHNGHKPLRRPNETAIDQEKTPVPQTLSHVVVFVEDYKKTEDFYVKRLGFRVSDRFTGVGPFLRPAGTNEHHCLFLIQVPPHVRGIEHFAFHMESITDVMTAGTRFVQKGYKSFWGPGRHIYGSNWFWYFNSPLGCRVEYDAEMDIHDDTWVPRETLVNKETAQAFLFAPTEKWFPGDGPH